ncbi:MAG TPA: hypothetical protein V6C71_15570 [Coleofasciculaceae cyanobacterium]|jgi:hypothetical protein
MKKSSQNYYWWLGISLLFTLYYGLLSYYHAFSQEYIVQDDIRQHIIWLQKYIDSELFPNDFIADYFQSLAPLGFEALYFWTAKVGFEPVWLAKILPVILAIITTVYIYLFTLKILPRASCAFLASLLVNQLIWLNDDLISATPRAFIYPFLAAFLYYLTINSLIPCLVLMLLQGLFYPHILLIEMVVLTLRLLVFKKSFSIKLTADKQPYLWWILGLIITAIALYPLTQQPPELATVITAEQMQQMPEFNPGGRTPIFGSGWFEYWFFGNSGLDLPLFPTIVWCSLGLPWILIIKLPVIKLITNKIAILNQVTIASLLMFALAHILLPVLHLPSRFTYHSLRIIMAIATAIVLTILIDIGKNWFNRQLQAKTSFKLFDKIKIALIIIFSITVIVVPAVPYIFSSFQNWQVGTAPEIYQYLAQQPKDILVASLSAEANNIPAFSQRSILVGDEFAYAYHPAYYNQIKQRTVDLLQAQYSANLKILQFFIRKYDLDYLLIDKNAFTPEYLLEKDWLINSSWSEETKKAIAQLESGSTPALTRFIQSCTVISTEDLILFNTACIIK